MNKNYGKTALKILDCATDIFAEKGFEGTIMDDLAEHCGVNKASIYYHFNDKASLYEVCMTRLFKKVVDQVILQVAQCDGLEEKLKTFVYEFAKGAYNHKQMPATLMREIAAAGKNMPVPARQQMQRLLGTLKEILIDGEKQGVFRCVDPLMIHFMIIGSLSFHITSEPMRLAIQSESKTDPSLDEAIGHVSELIYHALLSN
ncbi:TetR/AcrR family transcriptional regulator [Thiomicrospira sp.]|uniref:TetR/AcrR family transcriptional regulator n=1 Tax=Thiomicrospira sp. TaxID=935 RepID=UPI002F9502C9